MWGHLASLRSYCSLAGGCAPIPCPAPHTGPSHGPQWSSQSCLMGSTSSLHPVVPSTASANKKNLSGC
uniref:Uncharacterized protein n=1 Tax=Falco tinnunculus TaxID=100819 RepID=A0A8C4UWJ9_FALTI